MFYSVYLDRLLYLITISVLIQFLYNNKKYTKMFPDQKVGITQNG